jgi:hypothetical protein
MKAKQLIFTPIGYKKAEKGEWFKDRRGCLTPWVQENKTFDMYEVYTCEEIEVEIKVPHYRWMYRFQEGKDEVGWGIMSDYYPDEETVWLKNVWLNKSKNVLKRLDFTERLM